MGDWEAYIKRFYQLPREARQREWDKLTPHQRTQFEEALGGPSQPSRQETGAVASKKSRRRGVAIGCAVLAGLVTLGFLGLVILGSFVDSPARKGAVPNEVQDDDQADPSAAFAELEALIQDPEESVAALRGAREFLNRFPDSAEVARVEELVPELEAAAAEAEQLREERRRQQEKAERQRALAAKWTYQAGADEMTGRATRAAMIRSENSVNFAFPYHGEQRASLIVRTHPSYGRDVIFRIEQGQLLCRRIDRCQVRVKFDEGQPQTWRASPPADHSTTVLFLQAYDRFVQQLRRSEVVRIQPEVYQEGSPVFEFHVEGYDHSRYAGG